MDNEAFNDKIRDLENSKRIFSVQGLENTGKIIPYIGWYWRDVDFDASSISIGDCGQFKGFMENNKWGYPEASISGAELDKIKDLTDAVVQGPTEINLQALFDAMQEIETTELPY